MKRPSSRNRFLTDTRGATVLMFGLAALPLMFALGAVIDYSRASDVRSDLQAAVDGAALAAGRAVIDTGRREPKVQARAVFDAGFKRGDRTQITRFELRQTDKALTLEVDAKVPLMFASLLGKSEIATSAVAEVPLDVTTVEVALVLDNTGSMAWSGKMARLKEAATSLIDTLQNASLVNTKAEIAIVPFNTQVTVAPASPAPSWVRFDPATPEPKLQVAAAAWQGCIFDRDQNEDVRETLPNTAKPETLYPAAPCQYAGLSPIMPLTRDFGALRAAITAMTPTGNTNTGIGLAWGFNMLNPGAPLSATARAPGRFVKKYIIFLTDGLNTENRWTKTAVDIDKRTEKLCEEVNKGKYGITVYTIRVIEGNETLLRGCASSSDRFHSITEAAQLKPVFDAIATEIVSLRLAR